MCFCKVNHFNFSKILMVTIMMSHDHVGFGFRETIGNRMGFAFRIPTCALSVWSLAQSDLLVVNLGVHLYKLFVMICLVGMLISTKMYKYCRTISYKYYKLTVVETAQKCSLVAIGLCYPICTCYNHKLALEMVCPTANYSGNFSLLNW